jgi:hypothetical protein
VLLAKKIDLDTNELLAELSAPLRGEVALTLTPTLALTLTLALALALALGLTTLV